MPIIRVPTVKLTPGKDIYTKLLLHMNGTDNGTTFTDECGKIVTANGNACTKTGVKKFGTASGYFDGTGDYLSIPASSDFLFAGDLTVDFWVRFTTLQDCVFFGTNNTTLCLRFVPGSGFSIYAVGGNSSYISWAPVVNTWYHIALVRTSGIFRIAIDGAFLSTSYSNSNNVGSASLKFAVGAQKDGATNLFVAGYIDEFRISNGIARLTSNSTLPVCAYY